MSAPLHTHPIDPERLAAFAFASSGARDQLELLAFLNQLNEKATEVATSSASGQMVRCRRNPDHPVRLTDVQNRKCDEAATILAFCTICKQQWKV